jgi:hypothetical protein
MSTAVRKPRTPNADMELIAATVEKLNELGIYLRYAAGEPAAGKLSGWIDEFDLAFPERQPMTKLFEALSEGGFGGNRRALSASIMLRYGWSSGFLIGLWLTQGAVAAGARLSLRFSSNAVLMEIAVRDCARVFGADGDPAWLRGLLVRELAGRAAPIVEAHHRWSGFSRKALWSMVTSSWAAQFVHISEKLGEPERGLAEADALMRIDPEIEAARPELYMIEADGRRGVCQMRRLCCLWFKGSKRQFCASCPIIPEDERLERNRSWVAQRGVVDNL